jgi:hypothetical protein
MLKKMDDINRHAYCITKRDAMEALRDETANGGTVAISFLMAQKREMGGPAVVVDGK